jgi:xanthine dehydrogenase accessory factor
MVKDIHDHILEYRRDRRPYAIATVVETIGSVSAKTSAKAMINNEGQVVYGWVGGGCAESSTITQAIECIESGQTTVMDIDLDDEVLGAGMPCGGHMRVYVEPVLPKPTLWLMGHGRVAEVLCQIGVLMGLRVIINDAGAEWDKYPTADTLITDDLEYEQLNPLPEDYVVIATQHKGDHESIKRALVSGAGYVALIASRKRSGLVMDYLREEGVDEIDLQRVMAPCGLDLGPKTPEEIALCVISEITMLRRGGSGGRMRDRLAEKAN